MFTVLKIDGPNIVTDLGGISLRPFQYADGGKTKPVSIEDWQKMVALFAAAPGLLAACEALERWAASVAGQNLDALQWNMDLQDAVMGARAALSKADCRQTA